jgi:2-polyprenyl-3-methyl-5-hydroxy-6-metoxy-1,4-benzoquinol methylase
MKKTEVKSILQYDGGVESVECCALCDSTSYKADTLFSQKLGLIAPFECKKCTQCGLRWLSPRPTQNGYEQIYTMDNYFGGEHSEENYSTVVKIRKVLFRKRLKEMSRYFTNANRPKTLLDIGAATGEFVYEAKCNGYDAIGIELSSDARQQAKEKYSINLYENSLEELFTEGYRFDIIHMNHVFEHILNPNACLQECNNLLTKKGLLVIEVPQQFLNDIDRLKKILNMSKKPAFTPYSLHHTYFFTPKTITLILKKHSFSICKLGTANLANTPLWPFSFKNSVLAIYLSLSDKIHRGGNIIEVFAQKM